MRPAAVILCGLLGAGCASLAGLDEDYVVGSTAGTTTGGGGSSTTTGEGGTSTGAGGSGTGAGATSSGTSTGAAGGAGGSAGGAGGSGGGPLGFCDEPNLVACYRFESNADDGSLQANHAAASGVQYVPGVSGQAISLDGSSLVTAAPDPEWSPIQLTLETWLRPTQLPVAGRQGILDYNGRWGLFVYDTDLRCIAGGSVSGPVPTADQWTHVACTDDGSNTRLYVDGLEVSSAPSNPLTTSPDVDPVHISSNSPSGDAFIGQFDEMRIFDVARTQPQICAAAGGTGC